MILMGDQPDISLKSVSARHAQPMQRMKYSFLVVEEPIGKSVLLDFSLTNKEGLVGNMKAWRDIGCSNHKTVEFRILEETRQ